MINPYQESEHERIAHTHLKHINFFLIRLTFRTPHFHHDYEILQVIEGNLQIKTRKQNYTIGPGEIALFVPEEMHSLQSEGEYCVLLALQIEPAFLTQYYPAISDIRFETGNITSCTKFDITLKMIQLCMDIGHSYYSMETGYELRCVSGLFRLFFLIIKYVPHREERDSFTHQNQIKDRRFHRIIMYIHQHYFEKITLSQLAEKEGLTMTYLSHLFKEEMHISFQEYVNSLRFEHAVLLLQKTNMGILDICMETGFSDSKYLNKHFQQVYHMTPREFRTKVVTPVKSESFPDDAKNQQYIYTAEQGLEILKRHYHFSDF